MNTFTQKAALMTGVLCSSLSAVDVDRFNAVSGTLNSSFGHGDNPIVFIVIGLIIAVLITASLIQRHIHMKHVKKHHEETMHHQKELINHHKEFLDQVRRK